MSGMDDLRNTDRAALTITETAKILGVNPRTVSKGIADGTIPCVALGRRRLVPREKLLALFAGQAITTQTKADLRVSNTSRRGSE